MITPKVKYLNLPLFFQLIGSAISCVKIKKNRRHPLWVYPSSSGGAVQPGPTQGHQWGVSLDVTGP